MRELYVLKDVDGREITEAEGRKICAERYKVSAEVRAARKRAGAAQQMKRAGRGSKESTKAAPASGPPASDAIAPSRVA